jgi:hypothetical protein
MQVPYFVYIGWGRGSVGRYAAEVHKPFVFCYGPFGFFGVPLLLAGQLGTEWKGGIGFVYLKRLDSLPEWVLKKGGFCHYPKVMGLFLYHYRCVNELIII